MHVIGSTTEESPYVLKPLHIVLKIIIENLAFFNFVNMHEHNSTEVTLFTIENCIYYIHFEVERHVFLIILYYPK